MKAQKKAEKEPLEKEPDGFYVADKRKKSFREVGRAFTLPSITREKPDGVFERGFT